MELETKYFGLNSLNGFLFITHYFWI